MGKLLRDIIRMNPSHDFRLFGPDETASNRLGASLRGHGQVAPGGDAPG